MSILVTGANGQLGRTFQKICSSISCTLTENIYFTDIVEDDKCLKLDITDEQSVNDFIKNKNVRTIINCAAYTNVDKAENDYETAKLLNADAPLILANALKKVGGVLFHISTDYVFGNETYNTPCTEEQCGEPLGIYGITKKLGEDKMINSGCKYVIFRTSWLYSEYGNNFVKTMLNLMKEKNEIKVVCDQIGTPTYTFDLANAIMYLICFRKIEEYSNQIYHFSNEGTISWYDFAYEIKLLTYKNTKVLPCKTSEYKSNVKRPSYSVLDKTKFKNDFQYEIPYWKISLKKCLGNLL